MEKNQLELRLGRGVGERGKGLDCERLNKAGPSGGEQAYFPFRVLALNEMEIKIRGERTRCKVDVRPHFNNCYATQMLPPGELYNVMIFLGTPHENETHSRLFPLLEAELSAKLWLACAARHIQFRFHLEHATLYYEQ